MLQLLCKSVVLSITILLMSMFNFAFSIPQTSQTQLIITNNVSLTNNLYMVGTNANFAVWNPLLGKLSDYGYLGNWDLKGIAFDKAGTLWSVGFNNNVGKWNGTSWDDQGYLGGWLLKSIAYDKNGTLWGVSSRSTVGKWNGHFWEDQRFMGGWFINMLAFDKDGTLWCVGVNGNFAKWNGTSWEDQGGGWTLKMINFDANGDLWAVGTASNVGKWNGKSWDNQGYIGGWFVNWIAWAY